MALKQPILILGGGQLGLMIAESAARLGLVVDRYDPENHCVLPGTSNLACNLDFDSLMSRYAHITVEREAFPEQGISAQLATSELSVTGRALELIPDRTTQKTLLDQQNIATAAWRQFDRPEDLENARDAFGDVVIKARRGGYDGRGTWLLKQHDSITDIPLDKLYGNAIIEEMIPFTRELSIVGARNLAGECVFYPLVKNHHVDGILRLTLAPAQACDPLQAQAETTLRNLMETMDFYGVMAVEFFHADNQLLVNEIAPRVHNSGHWTQQGADLSQFDLHALALTDLPMSQPKVSGVTAMINLIGVEFDPAWLSRPGVLHWYGKSYRPGRKLGHVNLQATTLRGLEQQFKAWDDLLPDGAQAQWQAEIAIADH